MSVLAQIKFEDKFKDRFKHNNFIEKISLMQNGGMSKNWKYLMLQKGYGISCNKEGGQVVGINSNICNI